MSDTISKLLELQELGITLRETEIVHGDTQDDDAHTIKTRIETLRKEIGQEYLPRYDRLSKAGTAVVRIENDTCMGCNIGIARGDVNRIATGKLEPICPHCGKFVLVQETP